MGFFKKLHDKVSAPEANVELKFSSCSVTLGENLQGFLAIASKEDFDCDEVRFEIQCVEQARVIRQEYDPALKRYLPREVQESAVLFAAKPVLTGDTHISKGENRSFPLNINIPAGGRPTYQGVQNKVSWTIKGVIAVDGRPDATSHTAEIQVLSPTAQQIVREREVVREVVKIPCRFCGPCLTSSTLLVRTAGQKEPLEKRFTLPVW
ncbi:MAG TPA: hypothetical protein VJ066_03915 [Candidatus Bathyarchaeia archaeon]|nr:hypothetical protein [Candidatus Bathyarchaeia archaeon]